MARSGVYRLLRLSRDAYSELGRKQKLGEVTIMAGTESGSFEVAQATFPGSNEQSIDIAQVVGQRLEGNGIELKSLPMQEQLASGGLNKILDQMKLDPQTRSGVADLVGKLGNPMQDPFVLAKELYRMDPNSSIYKGFTDVMKKAGIEVTRGNAEDGSMNFKLKDGTTFSIGTTGGYVTTRPGEKPWVRTQEETNKANDLDKKMILQDLRIPLRNALRTESISR